MKDFFPTSRISALAVLCGALLMVFATGHKNLNAVPVLSGQESFPAPPADHTLIYVVEGNNALAALPFEAATTPLSIEKVSGGDKKSYVELPGESAATALQSNEPRFYLFVADVPNVHPPFIVSLTQKRGTRRVTALAQKGFKGFAVDSAAIIKPHYRVLGRAGGMLYMEIRPREMLLAGEYAIIGIDLQRVATFRLAGARPK